MFVQNLRLALNALLANKLRAALTMLGITIGVGAVITLLAIGDGVTRYVTNQFAGLGTNLIFIVSQTGEDPNGPPDRAASSTLTLRDLELLSQLPGVSGAAPSTSRNRDMQFRGNAYRATVQATTAAYARLRNIDLDRGRNLTDQDENGRSRVAVIGSSVAENLFGAEIDPLGETFKIDNINFRVVGIAAPRGGSGFGNQDDFVLVPFSTAQTRLFSSRNPKTGEPAVASILVQAASANLVDEVIIDATNTLRQTHNITFRDEDDFRILTQQDFLNAFGQITTGLTFFLGAIAAISLLVGGIGIMNIMLVSVTERTREIGLRKSVGARYADILGQFLTEAVVLALLGGVVGILLGWAGSIAIGQLVPDLETAVTPGAVLLAVGFSTAVGLFFGIYPASRAAGLHPIEALRFE